MVPLEHTDALFSYAMALTRNIYEAEDLVQETYLRAIRAVGRLRKDSNAKAWLFTILRNIWLNQVRQQQTGPKLLEIDAHENIANLVIESAQDPHAVYLSKLETQRVREALQKLSQEFREIIVLRAFGELSYQEIATVLDCAQGTVMSRLARARFKLRTLLSAARTSPLNARAQTPLRLSEPSATSKTKLIASLDVTF
jgi:RNA polymerase sigma-70 factor (ECF subfamily)